MQYKALIFDLDGTAILNRQDALPTLRLIEAVKKAKTKLSVCAATGRPITLCREIFKLLELESPCVISGGTQIVDPKTENVITNFPLAPEQVQKVLEACAPYPYEIIFNDELTGFPPSKRKVFGDERVIYIMTIDQKNCGEVLAKIRQIPNLAAHEVRSWTKDCFDIHITHAEATKKHALERLFNLLGVQKSEVISVGDSNNDLPLFESSGYKVAVGNATEELKKQADHIAPAVEEDGLAQFIEKFVLDEPVT